MIEVITYEQIDENEWQMLVDNSPTTSFFQTKECYDLYAGLSFLKPFVYGVKENGQLSGLVCGYITVDENPLKQFLSRRAIVPGGLLLDKEISIEALQELLHRLTIGLSSKAIYIEIRNYNDYTPYKETLNSAGFLYYPHLNFHVATSSVDSALKNLSSTKRRDIKLSLKQGAIIEQTHHTEEIHHFYFILQNLYNTKIKTPLFPVTFFENIVSHDFGKLFVIKKDNEVIGGSLCVMLSNRVMYEWFVCGEDRKYKNIFPSTMATWAAIEYAAVNGFEYFDMMGAGKPEDGYGVRDFKARFGGEMVEHGRFLSVLNPLLFDIGRWGVKLLKKI